MRVKFLAPGSTTGAFDVGRTYDWPILSQMRYPLCHDALQVDILESWLASTIHVFHQKILAKFDNKLFLLQYTELWAPLDCLKVQYLLVNSMNLVTPHLSPRVSMRTKLIFHLLLIQLHPFLRWQVLNMHIKEKKPVW